MQKRITYNMHTRQTVPCFEQAFVHSTILLDKELRTKQILHFSLCFKGENKY